MSYDLQKASVGKRLSAWLFDAIIFACIVVGLAYILSLVTDYSTHSAAMDAAYAKYEKEYSVDFDIWQEEGMTEEEAKEYQDRYMKAYEALIKDEEAMRVFNLVVNLSLLIATFSILLTYLILEFAVPSKLGNGQTFGKKIFGIAVMRVDGIRINGPLLFIRTVLGKFTIETMIPVYIILMIFLDAIGVLGTIIIGLILLVQIILIITTHTNSMIHDILAKTVVVDYASQLIFDSEEAMIAYKTKKHAEEANAKAY